jgi:sortase B
MSAAVSLKLCCKEIREEKIIEDLQEIHKDDGESEEWPSQSFLQLSDINGDYFGWLTVEGTDVDLPVVLGEDNEYYLKHDFYQKENRSGALFADSLTKREEAGNLLIYGHNMKNGSMFGSLKSFYSQEFFQNYGLVKFEDAYGVWYYEIFAVLVVPGEETAEDFLSVREYLNECTAKKQGELLGILKDRALLWKERKVSDEDRLIFLMTCDYSRKNGRLLLCGKAIV